MKEFYVYLHLRPGGDIFYVGKGSGNRSHDFARRHQHHKDVVAQFGRNNIEIMVFPCKSEQESFVEEKRITSLVRETKFNLVNVLDGGGGVSGGTRDKPKTHCIHGHEFTLDNTIRHPSGSRYCRACARRRTLESWRKANGKTEQPKFSKLYCIRGHPLFGEDVYFYNGHRQCKECQRQRTRQWREAAAA